MENIARSAGGVWRARAWARGVWARAEQILGAVDTEATSGEGIWDDLQHRNGGEGSQGSGIDIALGINFYYLCPFQRGGKVSARFSSRRCPLLGRANPRFNSLQACWSRFMQVILTEAAEKTRDLANVSVLA